MKYIDLRLIDNGYFHRSVLETEIGSVACYLSVDATTNKSIASKQVVINSVRGSTGMTYLEVPLLRTEDQEMPNGEVLGILPYSF